MKRIALLACLAALPIAACTDQEAPTAPMSAPQSSDTEATTDNPHFSFLAPLGSGDGGTGVLNTRLSPVVEICKLEVGATACDDVQPDGFPLRFGMADGDGTTGSSDNVRLEDDHYIVNWHTSQTGVEADQRYRISVMPVGGAAPLGHAYVLFKSKGGEPATEGDIETKAGRTLPVKFRIEQGALCDSDSDCAEAVVGPEGGTVVTSSGFGGVDILEGSLEAPVVIIVERIDVSTQPCLPTDLEQAEGCYRFDTDPALSAVQTEDRDGDGDFDEFHEAVTVGVCLDPAAQPEHHYQLHQFDEEKADLGVRALPEAQAPFIDCTGFEPIADEDDGGQIEILWRSLGQAAHDLARLLGPAELMAADKGLGGLTTSFSNIGWARPFSIDIHDGDLQSATVGTSLPVDPTVRVTAAEWDEEEGPAPALADVVVHFVVESGGGGIPFGEGLVSSLTVLTDENGLASVPWTLGSEPGENELSASVAGGASVVFSATATPLGFSLLTITPSGLIAFDETGASTVLTAEAENSVEVLGSRLFVRWGDAIRELDATGEVVNTVTISETLSGWLRFVALPAGGFALLDNLNDVIHLVDASGALEQTVALPEASPSIRQVVDGIVLDDRLIVSETGTSKIAQVDLTTGVASIFRDFSDGPGSGYVGAIEHQDGTFFLARPSQVQAFTEEGPATTLVSFDGINVVGVEPVGEYLYSILNFAGELHRTEIGTGTTTLVTNNITPDATISDLEYYPADLVPNPPPIE